jgi:hypothetical protein
MRTRISQNCASVFPSPSSICKSCACCADAWTGLGCMGYHSIIVRVCDAMLIHVKNSAVEDLASFISILFISNEC